jgi:protein-S-isoprenylcysteine O-methyltransferase Ste14
MDKISVIVLVACWAVWAWPFLAFKARAPRRPAQVTVTASRWGIGLQMAAYAFAWYGGPVARPAAVEVVAIVFGILAVALSWSGVHSLGKQLRVQAGLYADHELIRSGPYRIVRHPIYAGMLAMYLATALIRSPWIPAAIGFVLMIAGTEIRVHIEDGLLASRFGERFRQFKASTPAYVPFVR